MSYIPDLTKEELNSYPIYEHDGNIHVISSAEEADRVAALLSAESYIGFDTETRPAFSRGVSYKVALLQLATSKDAYLFRLHHTGITNSMAALLSDIRVTKIGVALNQDIQGLKKWKPFRAAGFVDLQDFVKPFGINSNGLSKLSAIVLGYRVSKGQQLSNWENDELTPAQCKYAATDAWVSYFIYNRLISI